MCMRTWCVARCTVCVACGRLYAARCLRAAAANARLLTFSCSSTTRATPSCFARMPHSTLLPARTSDGSEARSAARHRMTQRERCALRDARSALNVACCTLRVARSRLRVARCTLHAAHCMLHVARAGTARHRRGADAAAYSRAAQRSRRALQTGRQHRLPTDPRDA